MALRYLQASKVKVFMKEKGLRTSRGFLIALDHEVARLAEKYSTMAKMDRRKTVMAIDVELPKTLAALVRGVRR